MSHKFEHFGFHADFIHDGWMVDAHKEGEKAAIHHY